MTSKALLAVSFALLDSNCPNRYQRFGDRNRTGNSEFIRIDDPILDAIKVLKGIRQLHYMYASPGSASSFSASTEAVKAVSSTISIELRKQLDVQKREADRYLKTAVSHRKRQNKKGEKRWKAAFEKSAIKAEQQCGKLPHRGILDTERSSTVSHNSNATVSTAVHEAKSTHEIKGSRENQDISTHEISRSSIGQVDNEKSEKDEGKSAVQEDGDIEDFQETLLGATALVGLVTAVGLGVVYFFRKRNQH